MTANNPREAFNKAIADGRLSADPNSPLYAGHYMYMYHDHATDQAQFKHIVTRKYLEVAITWRIVKRLSKEPRCKKCRIRLYPWQASLCYDCQSDPNFKGKGHDQLDTRSPHH